MESQPSRRVFLGGAAAALGLAATAHTEGDRDSEQEPAPSQEATDAPATLARLLAGNREKHPVYGGGLANHLSMELCALEALGATSQRLVEYSTRYSKHLSPFPSPGEKVAHDTWRAQLGRDEALHGFAQFFGDDLKSRGREPVLREVLEVFAPTLSADLFHCMIRTAYGVQFNDDDEIAHGLAYWAIRQQPLGALGAKSGESDFASLLARVRSTPALGQARLTGNSNPSRLRQASQLDGFGEVVNALVVDDQTLDGIARATLEVYATTRDFTALHAVTSTHALRILLPYFPDRELAVRYQAQALIASYIRMGAPAIDAPSTDDAPAWEATVAKAIASADDHDAKFVYSCRDEQQARGGELYRVAAARRIERA